MMKKKVKCKNNHSFTPMLIRKRTGDETLYDQRWKPLCCPECGDTHITSIPTDGTPMIGAWSTMNVSNQKGKS